MSSFSLRLPESLHRNFKEAANVEWISTNQFICLAVAEKLSALQTYDIIAERAKGRSSAAFLSAMSRVPAITVQNGDEMP